ncbi:hypothetical protein SELMODRAFT_410974 [Selaginella moellendorffii]|uniref:Uncharacterized protein n=1 Tax=Selaginella moellendorffii TaxID=88036 RepID=D8RHL5_SELML|nr:hypothetical protein SELMODRAFT_410974 [Selaginella moellendorffii]
MALEEDSPSSVRATPGINIAKEGALTQEFSLDFGRVIWGLKAVKSVPDQESCVQSDALMLIDLRRTLCNLLRTSGRDEAHLIKVENDLDNVLMQHIASSWKDDAHLQSLDRDLLMADIKECLHPITFSMPESDASSVTLDANPPQKNLVKVEPSPAAEEREETVPLLFERGAIPATNSSDEAEELLDVEMTMTARMCREQGAPSWRVVFGLINHSSFKIDVDSLSFWPRDRISDMKTVKWTKGEVSLNEKPAFICYSIKRLSDGQADSPHFCFSWSYKKSSKHGKRTRLEVSRKKIFSQKSIESTREFYYMTVLGISSSFPLGRFVQIRFRSRSLNTAYAVLPPEVLTAVCSVDTDKTGRYQETRSLDQFVTKFRTVQEATERTNNTKYVLAEVCGAFTKDIDTANWDPCGSSPKMSGQGREKGEYVLHNYTQVKAVVTALRNPA